MAKKAVFGIAKSESQAVMIADQLKIPHGQQLLLGSAQALTVHWPDCFNVPEKDPGGA